MAEFDRFDICAAHRAIECDWHTGGILRERPSNRRRNESTGVQLHRMRFVPALDSACSFETLENDNQRAIYCDALQRYGFTLDRRDPSHREVINWLAGE